MLNASRESSLVLVQRVLEPVESSDVSLRHADSGAANAGRRLVHDRTATPPRNSTRTGMQMRSTEPRATTSQVIRSSPSTISLVVA